MRRPASCPLSQFSMRSKHKATSGLRCTIAQDDIIRANIAQTTKLAACHLHCGRTPPTKSYHSIV